MSSTPRPRTRARWSTVAMAVAVLTVAAGCGSAGGAGDGDAVQVSASFYPLAWLSEQVGGDLVEVSDLTQPGVEPHDLELTPREVAAVSDADLTVYLAGFQTAVDDLVAQDLGPRVLDAAPAADLQPGGSHDGDGGHDDDGDETLDPHFWLDPIRLGEVGLDLAEALAEVDPANAATYRANAAALETRLAALDETLAAGLADCTNRELVTSHESFGYLAQRYGFEQVGISGLSPEVEPAPDELAAAVEYVEDNDVTTIYFETLVSPSVAEVVASETGAETAVLDPIEGLTDASAGDDYLEIMTANLAELRAGQGCS